MEGPIMHVKSEWTPSGVALWLIAAIAATLVVCSQLPEAAPAPGPTPAEAPNPEVDFQVVQE
jgi:hypothetical protein